MKTTETFSLQLIRRGAGLRLILSLVILGAFALLMMAGR